MNYTWPLNTNHFSCLDRLKIAGFILNSSNRWTADKRVIELEKKWARRAGFRYAVMTSSGSTAIEILARTWKETHKVTGNKIFVPAITWATSITPWIYAGFDPVFVDVNANMVMCRNDLGEKLKQFSSEEIAGIFPTAILGSHVLTRSFENLGYPVALDSCESCFNMKYSTVTCVTSLYFGHQCTTGTEGGLLLTDNANLYDAAIYARGHGLTRELAKYDRVEVAEKFEFETLGSNFRSNDIAAYMGLLDFKRYDHKVKCRQELYDIYMTNISGKYYKFYDITSPFALPIVPKIAKRFQVRNLLDKLGIEHRSIVGGNLLRHKAFSKYGNPQDYPNAQFFHDNGLYIGLHEGIRNKQMKNLVKALNELAD